MTKNKKSMLISELFKYILAGLFAVLIVTLGYKYIASVTDNECKTEVGKFEIDAKHMGDSLRYGAREMQSLDVPCGADKIYFFDSANKIDMTKLPNIPIMKDSVGSKTRNVFLIKNGEILMSFDAGSLFILDPFYLCMVPHNSKILIFAEGKGNSVGISAQDGQAVCS